jgi:hypothetical protein
MQLTWPKIEIRLPNYVVVSCTREEEKVTPEKEEYLVFGSRWSDVFLEQEATEDTDATGSRRNRRRFF